MPLRIFFKSWRFAFRTKRRFIVFTVAYSILLFWIAQIVRAWIVDIADIFALGNLLYSLAAGAIMGIAFAWWLAHGRRDDISILKCVGWSNHNIRELVLGEIIFITFAALAALTFLAVGMSGLWYTTYVGLPPIGAPVPLEEVPVHPFLVFWVVPPQIMWGAFGAVMLSQLPGILLLTWRVLRISPMRALRRTE